MSDGVFATEARALGAAIRFLTRAPAPFPSTNESWRADLSRSPRYFPLVGGAVGAITGAVFFGLTCFLPPTIASAIALAVEALLTGAFHEDALADFADAFGGASTPERTREILKDSRIGSYGALALGLAVLIRWSALAGLPPILAPALSAASGAIARLAILAVMAVLAPAPDRPSLAKDIGSQPSAAALIAGLAFTLAIAAPAAFALPLQTAIGAAACGAVALFIANMMRRRLDGSVGDGLGAIGMSGQTLSLAAFSVRL